MISKESRVRRRFRAASADERTAARFIPDRADSRLRIRSFAAVRRLLLLLLLLLMLLLLFFLADERGVFAVEEEDDGVFPRGGEDRTAVAMAKIKMMTTQ